MFRRSKHLIVAGLIAAGATTLIPTPALAMAPCQVRDVAKFQEYSHEALVTGQYVVPGAIDVQLTCGIVQTSGSVIRITDKLVGPAAALAQLTSIQGQNYSVCNEIVVTYTDHTVYTDTCP